MSDSWKEIRKETENIEEVIRNLFDLAYAFEITGNVRVSRDLRGMASVLRDSSDTIKKQLSGIIDTMWIDSQQASMNVLNTTLAGITLEKDSLESGE